MRYLSEIFWRHSWGVYTLVPNTYTFLYVCQSISWLTYLLKWGQYRNISCPGWDIFLKFFGDIPWMFLHNFSIIKNCLYVCQSVRWLTSLLKLDKYRHISGPEWDIFLNFFGDIPWMLLHHFQKILNFLYVCQSVSWLTSLLKLDKYRDISGPEWAIFLKFFGDIPRMVLHHFQIILNFLCVCQSVSWLTSLLKLDKCRDISSSGWDISLKNLGAIPDMLVHYMQIIWI